MGDAGCDVALVLGPDLVVRVLAGAWRSILVRGGRIYRFGDVFRFELPLVAFDVLGGEDGA